MARDPFRFETNLDYGRPLSAPTVEPFLQTVQPRIDDFQAPKHALINSLRMQIRQANEEKLRRWNESVDEPAIIKSIAEARQQADERNKRFDSILARYENPDVPLEETTPVANWGEAIAGAAGMLVGDRNAPNEVASIAKARQKAIFAKRMGQFAMQRQAEETALERASRDLDYYRSVAAQGEQNLHQMRMQKANFDYRDQERADEQDFALAVKSIDHQYQQQADAEQRDWERQKMVLLQDYERERDKVAAQSKVDADLMDMIWKGLETFSEDPDKPNSGAFEAGWNSIKQIAAKYGVQIPDSVVQSGITLARNKAQRNFRDEQWQRTKEGFMMRVQGAGLALQQRGQALDEQKFGFLPGSLGKGPGGGFLSVLPQNGPSEGFPTGSPGSDEWSKLMDSVGKIDTLEAQLANDKPETRTLPDGSTIQVNTMTEKDRQSARAALAEEQGKVGRLRKMVVGQNNTAVQMWLAQEYDRALEAIRNVKGDPASEAAASLTPGAMPPTKVAKDQIRKQFKKDTGFDMDGNRALLEDLRKKFIQSAQPVLPGGPTGAIGK